MDATAIATLLGLIRDLVAAVIGLLILFDVGISDDQVAGILLVVATASALGSWLYLNLRKEDEPEPPPPPPPATSTSRSRSSGRR